MREAIQRKLDAHDTNGALLVCRTRLDEAPDDADAHRHLAQLLAGGGKFVAAHRHGRRACELAPDDARSWSDYGRVYAMEGNHREAVRCFLEAVDTDPRHADGWHNLGTALHRLNDLDGAFTALKRALLLDGSRGATWLNLGNLLIATGQIDDAIECFERASRFDPSLARARSRLAQELSRQGRVRRAEMLFRQSLGLDPHHLQGWFGLGRTLEDLGERSSAVSCYLNVLERRPDHALAMGHYLALVEESIEPALLQRAEAALEDGQANGEARTLIGYGLCKYHDRRRDFAAAARCGKTANRARRQRAGVLDRAALRARVDHTIATFDRDFFAARRRFGVGADQPVFIVGLPRSGTTLTEQIIAAHPLLHGAGELPDLARLAVQQAGEGAQPWQAAAGLDQVKSLELGQRYLRALRNGAPKRRLRISDKSPLNFFHLAFAALLLPNARVIHCVRDARDNALSIWMENFNPDQRYATDFDDLAFYRTQYQRLMAHWRAHLPLPMLELNYEETVADLEGQARRLIDFLGVPWNPACLDFHRSGRVVQTPSRWQVRQPVYTRSVGRWRQYAACLPGLMGAFPAAL